MGLLIARLRDQPYLLLSLTSLFWAGNAVVGRAVVHAIPPVALAQFRWTGAFLILLPFALRQLAVDWPIIRQHVGVLSLLALMGISTFNTLLYWSLQYTTAINATLMQSSGPLLIGLWSLVLYREPLTRWQTAGIAVSLLGVAVIVGRGDLTHFASLELNVGDVVVLIAMLAYALYSTLLRKRPAMASLSFAALTIGLGALFLLPVTIIELIAGAHAAALGAGAVAGLAYVVIFPSILAYLCFNRGVQLIGPNRAGPFFHLIPLFGALLAILFLGERPAIYHGVGAVLIIGGVVVASRSGGFGGKKRIAATHSSP